MPAVLTSVKAEKAKGGKATEKKGYVGATIDVHTNRPDEGRAYVKVSALSKSRTWLSRKPRGYCTHCSQGKKGNGDERDENVLLFQIRGSGKQRGKDRESGQSIRAGNVREGSKRESYGVIS